jgi:MFS family permease
MIEAGVSARDEGQGTAGYRYLILTLLIVVYTFNFIDRQILGILAGAIKRDLHLTDTQLGAMSGLAFAVFYTLLGIPIAWLADRGSRTWIMTGALTLWSGFTAACGLAGGFWPLFLCRMGVGVGEAGGTAPAYSLISDYFPARQRARALAAYSFGIPIGTAAGYLLGGLISAATSWRIAFMVVGGAGVLLAPLLRLVLRDPKRGGAPAPSTATPDAAPEKAAGFGEVMAILLPKPSFWLISFGAAASSTCGYGIAFWLPSFFERSLHLPLVERSLILAALAFFGGVLGVWMGGSIADRFGKSKAAYCLVPAIAFLIALPCFFAAVNSANLALAFFLFLIPQGLNLAWLGPVITAVQHLVPARMRSTSSAAFLFINNLIGLGLGNVYFGVMADLLKPRFGTEALRYSIYSGLTFYLVSAILFLFAARRISKDWVD